MDIVTYGAAVANAKRGAERLISGVLDTFPNGVTLKGSVNSVDDLPASGEVGDGYIVTSEGIEYAWDGEAFIPFGHEIATDAETSAIITEYEG